MSQDYEKEKREAIEAGTKALSSLKAAKRSLSDARGWGIFDILGGGILSTLIKHSKMNEANRYISQAKSDLHKFSRELNDISYIYEDNFNMSEFASFADYFFDNFFMDMYVQSKITTLQSKVDEAIYRVETILDEIR